jgi:hypothetical protein
MGVEEPVVYKDGNKLSSTGVAEAARLPRLKAKGRAKDSDRRVNIRNEIINKYNKKNARTFKRRTRYKR